MRASMRGVSSDKSITETHDHEAPPPPLPSTCLLFLPVRVPLLRVHGKRCSDGVQEAPHGRCEGLGLQEKGEAHGEQGQQSLGHVVIRQVPAVEQRNLALTQRVLFRDASHRPGRVRCFLSASCLTSER